MELEELMTNRVLLEKMSSPENRIVGSTPFRKHHHHHPNHHHANKHVIIQENHSTTNNSLKPKEIRIEYKNSHNSIYTTTTEHSITPPPPPLVLEGYGCKCPHKLKKVMKILWLVLLFLYIFGMPIVLVHIHTKLTQTEDKLVSLETRFNKHLGIEPPGGDSSNIKTLKYTGGEDNDNNKVGVEEGERITNKFNHDLQVQLDTVSKMVQEHKKRSYIYFNIIRFQDFILMVSLLHYITLHY